MNSLEFDLYIPLVTFFASFLLSMCLTQVFVWVGIKDIPNERSSHKKVTPRSGGVGFVLITLGYLLFATDYHYSIWVGLFLVSLVGFVDDISGHFSSVFRFLVHTLAAVLVVLSHSWPGHLGFAWFTYLPIGVNQLFWIFWIVGAINLTNFMDGIDGLAGSHGFLLFLALSGVFVSPFAICISGALFGFLVFNWPPAKIFMGDVGSGALGFLFAIIPLAEGEPSLLWVGGALGLFWGDALFTLIRRIWRREKFWQPHRTHLYQLLTNFGWSHARVTLTYAVICIFLMVSLSMVGEIGPFMTAPLFILTFWLLVKKGG